MLEWILSRLLAKDLQVSNGLSLFKTPLCKDTPTLPLFSTPSMMLYCTVYIYVIYIYTVLDDARLPRTESQGRSMQSFISARGNLYGPFTIVIN